ncbi:methyltransferase domain-containing protein [Paenibacillus sp. HJL G12]|uniref:Methyltransferase domain-containing protein n=1 Tax=Paenibacillus dendrobii TaxID=2691084 RepID=A0A7X3IG28_9BACL|nr:class I SAM-dependent methyltransferase [Paenibacillus dendrobii]MWV43278.1 methyltransferase domain-containing protein [Paenibacillus dendrobii]
MSGIPAGNRHGNIERFSGFEDTYDRYRPSAPRQVIDILSSYIGRKPGRVLDIGCGTGLSTFIWMNHAEEVVGIEPNDDMRGKAEAKLRSQPDHDAKGSIRFISGYSNQLDFKDGSADLITCSQSFHWMEPISTLAEAARVLQPGGVFAAYDCDWPPTASWQAEKSYVELLGHADMLLRERQEQQDQAIKRNKESHLQSIIQSGKFRYAREIVFHNQELCDADRYIGLALSQGGLQTVMKLGMNDLEEEIRQFKAHVIEHFQDRTLEVLFSYRMRIGIK